MSQCESDSAASSISEDYNTDSTGDSIGIEFEEPSTVPGTVPADGHDFEYAHESDDEIPYKDEPLADEEWLSEYNRQIMDTEEQEKELENRLRGTIEITTWCKCGNCSLEYLQNISECYCCTELDGCGEALNSDLVTEDVGPNVTLKCIIEHPGFFPVCLGKWSLRMAADHYKTKKKTRYQQTGSEEGFLRSVAYREFSRLVYGFLGNKRIPLPACAYTQIRKTLNTDDEFTGFELEEPSTSS